MKTEVIKLDDIHEKEAFLHAAKLIQDGELVAFPTETVYGLGGDGLNPKASEKIYAAKGRPSDNPLILHIADFEDLDAITTDVSENARKIMNEFWPGPMTVVLKKSDIVPKETTGGLDTVAVRMPGHKQAREFIRACHTPIAAPSANTSGRPSPTTAEYVFEDMDGRIPLILDGGQVGIGIESTIVDMTGEHPVILRPGFITEAMLEEVVSGVSIDPAITGNSQNTDFVPKAPGMKYRHYAPKCDMCLVEGQTSKVVEKINELIEEKTKEGYRVGVLATEEIKEQIHGAYVTESLGFRQKPDTIAHSLYLALRKMDDADVDFIYSESFGQEIMGGAVRNRILKAAGYMIIKV